ncbi:hypothetical protein ACWN8B_10245 [Vagococcus zengguangii]
MKIKLNVNESYILGAIQYRTSDRPISSTEIESVFKFKDSDVRKFVNKLRLKGIPIASNHKGYYISQNKIELVEYLSRLNHRINEMLNVHKSLQGIDDLNEWHEMIELDNYYLINKDNEQIEIDFDDIA